MEPLAVADIAAWHDFFLMTGTAAVTLVGLLFVAVSFNLDVVVHEDHTYLMGLSRQTFLGFVLVLVISLIFLVPNNSIRSLGIQVAMFGLFIAVHAVRGLRQAIKHRDPIIPRRFLIARSAGSLLGAAFLALGGNLLMRRDMEGIKLLASALLIIFGFAAGSAWALLVSVGKAKATREKNRRPL